MRIPQFRGDLPQRRHERPSGLAPGRAKRRCPGGISLATAVASPWLFFCECQRCEIMAAVPTRVRLGLGMDEPRPLPVVSSASRRLEVGKRWRWARLGAMPIDVHSRMRVRANLPCPTSSPCWSVAPNLRRQAGWESSGFGICGWTGRPPLGSCTPKILRGAHLPACRATISPKPGITSRPCRPI